MQNESHVSNISDTAPLHARRAIPLQSILLGTRDHKNFEIVIHDNGRSRKVKCTIFLGYSRDYDRTGPEFFEELNQNMPALRESVIRVLGNKNFEELQMKNLDRIEDELLSKINGSLQHGSVADIMFSDYALE